jgi:hypothetical protein
MNLRDFTFKDFTLIEDTYGKKKLFFKDATQKSGSMVVSGILIELQPWSPIFEKCSHLREKGGVLTQIRAHGE